MTYEFDQYSVQRLVTGRWNENCYLVKDRLSNDITIFDPGDDPQAIVKVLEELGGSVRYIALTHGHYDHLCAASLICDFTGLPCSVHDDDIQLLRRAPIYAMAFEKMTIVIPDNIVVYDEKQRLEMGKHSIEIVATPGHTPGSVCFDFGPFILSGDTLFKNAIGRSDLPGGDLDDITQSVKLLVNNSGRDTILFPGHGSPWNIGEARDWWNECQSPIDGKAEIAP